MLKHQKIQNLSIDEIDRIAGGPVPYLAVVGIYIAVHLVSEYVHHHT